MVNNLGSLPIRLKNTVCATFHQTNLIIHHDLISNCVELGCLLKQLFLGAFFLFI